MLERAAGMALGVPPTVLALGGMPRLPLPSALLLLFQL